MSLSRKALHLTGEWCLSHLKPGRGSTLLSSSKLARQDRRYLCVVSIIAYLAMGLYTRALFIHITLDTDGSGRQSPRRAELHHLLMSRSGPRLSRYIYTALRQLRIWYCRVQLSRFPPSTAPVTYYRSPSLLYQLHVDCSHANITPSYIHAASSRLTIRGTTEFSIRVLFDRPSLRYYISLMRYL